MTFTVYSFNSFCITADILSLSPSLPYIDYVISVNTNVLTINEDGSFNQNSDLEISESGFSYGDIVLTITPLTYTEYEERTGQDLADIFPRLPDEASG